MALASQNSIPTQKHSAHFLTRTRSNGRSLPLTFSGPEVATASAVTARREGWKIHAITPKGDSGFSHSLHRWHRSGRFHAAPRCVCVAGCEFF
jgi:hypothetical protein